jgi:O-antigen ligase/polysaccharide polymerase Wzy-like membrane protein
VRSSEQPPPLQSATSRPEGNSVWSIPARTAWNGVGPSVVLAILWGFHAAAYGYPGRAYFYVAGLNDISKPVGASVLFLPAFACAILFVVLQSKPDRTTLTRSGTYGIPAALACWFLGATAGTVANWNVDQVLLTYCSVFLAGAVVYAAIARVRLTAHQVEIGILGLVVGSLFPLMGGLFAFVQEWGVPDITTALNAYLDLARMQLYEQATFGNRGNTAGFIIIIAPLFLWVALDVNRRRLVRAVCAVALVPVILNVVILGVRAELLTLLFSLAVIWGFKLGIRRYPLFVVAFFLAVMLGATYSPDVAMTMFDRLRPVIAADTEEDRSLMERSESIQEGLAIAEKNWQVGIGPGGALTRHSQTAAHQFQVQQFMETGILGLIGSIGFAACVLAMLVATVIRGKDGGANNIRFALIIGPASYVVYGLTANATLNIGYVNTWTVLITSMLALTPGFEPRLSPVRRRTVAASLRCQPTAQHAMAGASPRAITPEHI